MPPLYQQDPFLLLQRLISPHIFWIELLWMALTIACEGWAMAIIAVGYAGIRTRRLRATVAAGGAAVASLLLASAVVQIVKHLLRTPRPLEVLGPERVHVLLEPLRLHGFPSGHSASAAAIATWGILRWRGSAWPLFVLALLGGLSRVAVGAHWTFDVLGGWTVGVLAGLAVHALERWLARRRATEEKGAA